jgi:hypothetical protein
MRTHRFIKSILLLIISSELILPFIAAVPINRFTFFPKRILPLPYSSLAAFRPILARFLKCSLELIFFIFIFYSAGWGVLTSCLYSDLSAHF